VFSKNWSGSDFLELEEEPKPEFIGLAYQGKDIVFRFIIEYSSLMDIGT
jgi:hypothetical protein